MPAEGTGKVLFLVPQLYSVYAESLSALNERRPVEVAVFGSRKYHAGADADAAELPFRFRRIREQDAQRISRERDVDALVIDARGRIAFGATLLDRKRVAPLILWSTLWEFPMTLPWLIGRQLVKHGYRTADAVVTPGIHISQKAHCHGAANVWEAPPSVSAEYWSAPVEPEREYEVEALFVGRPEPGKGIDLLIAAWRASRISRSGNARLRLVGLGSDAPRINTAGVEILPAVELERLRKIHSGSDFLISPSRFTRTFSEDWGHSTSEAMMAGKPVIASDQVGAAAAGCIRDGETGLVFPAGNEAALTTAIDRMASDPDLRVRLGKAGRAAVLANTPELWAQRMDEAIGFAIQSKEMSTEGPLGLRYA